MRERRRLLRGVRLRNDKERGYKALLLKRVMAAVLWRHAGIRASLSSTPSVVRAPESSRVSSHKTAAANTEFVRKAARSSFKTAQDLARPFPFEVLASGACPYCCNTGYSSPGTRCSYCRTRER